MLEASARDNIRRIRNACKRMAVLIDDLLRLSKVSRTEIHLGECDLAAIGREIVQDLFQANPARHVDSSILPSILVRADESLIRVALENLLRNSWKFTSRQSRVHIEVRKMDENGKEIFYIKDDGSGFDDTYVDKLFKAFQRLHKQEEFEGTGIGLAIVK